MINLSILKIGNWFEILKTCAGHLFVDQMEHACWSHPAPELQLETSVLQHQVGLNGLYPKNNMPGSERGQRCKDEWNKFSAFRKFYVWCRRQTIRKASQNTTVCCWYTEENQALPDTELVLSERNLGRLSGGGGTRSISTFSILKFSILQKLTYESNEIPIKVTGGFSLKLKLVKCILKFI